MKVAFLDRDGTIIFEPPNGVVRPEDFAVLPGVTAALQQLKKNGYTLVMITNQNLTIPFNKDCYTKTQQMLMEILEKEGIRFDQIFMCPHTAEDNCNCRKPKTGMVDDFLHEHQIDLSQSFVTGDRPEADGEFARRIGVRFAGMKKNSEFPIVEQLMSYESN